MTTSKKKCRFCGDFGRTESMLKVPLGYVHDNDKCLIGLAKDQREKTVKARKKIATKRTREDKTKLNESSIRWQTKKTQERFNLFIRLRDKDKPCITSGKTDAELPDMHGGKWDCGHFLTVGAHPHLRFWPANAHKQSKKDNGGAGNYTAKEHTTQQIYREKILERISERTLVVIEGPHDARKYTCDELDEMRRIINAEIRFIEKNGKPSRDWLVPGDVLQIAKSPL